MNPFTWIRSKVHDAFLAGIADAVALVNDGGPLPVPQLTEETPPAELPAPKGRKRDG